MYIVFRVRVCKRVVKAPDSKTFSVADHYTGIMERMLLILMLTLVCVSATPGSLRGKALVSFGLMARKFPPPQVRAQLHLGLKKMKKTIV